MKFADLITRLESYLKEKPERLNNDIVLIVDDLHVKYSEYKRIKKVVFKRQVEKAYEALANDPKFNESINKKINDENVETNSGDESDDDNDSIDEQSLAVAIKGDNMNEINNMITDIYKSNNNKSTLNGNNSVLKSNIKTQSMFDPPTPENSIPSNKKVQFSKELTVLNNNELNNNKRKALSNEFNQPSKKNIKQDSLSNNKTNSTYKKSKDTLIDSQVNFEMFACDEELKEMIFRRIFYILSPEHFQSNGKTPPRGFLLHGPPGTGKTQLVYAIAGELNIPLLKVTSTELISGVSGESEENIRSVFEKAIKNAPCILFIDEIEAISQRRETATKNMEHRIVTQLLACFDDLAVKSYVPLVVIGATNQADSLDIGLRRAGRFDQEIPIGIPDEKQRKKILQILCRKIKKNNDLDIDKIVLNTPGYVGADLNALIDEALISALDRKLNEQIKYNHNNDDMEKNSEFISSLIDWIKNKLTKIKTDELEKMEDLTINNNNNERDCNEKETKNLIIEQIEINQNDFEIAISRVQPSSKREGFATVPDVSWEDIGALQNVRDELKTAILAPVKYARQCEIFNFTKPPGILMVGPPGCGKTLLAKAIAKESGVNFISVKGPELLNMYVGESERAVRSLFQRARNSKPCVIFFDEIDAICVKRTDSATDSGATTRVVNQMLTEMDGLESRKGVFLMAASNRPDIVDPAILRPGRLDKIIYVGLPNVQDKFEILNTITKKGTKPKIDTNVDFQNIANDPRCSTYTGADLSALVREASEFALKEFIKNPIPENEIVKLKHFEQAFNKIKPSVSFKDCERYEKMKSMCINLQ